MMQPGYQVGAERGLWWKVAKHLDEARVAAVNAMAHNLDDPSRIIVLQDVLRDAQAILLEIFRAKGLLPSGMNGGAEVRLPPAPPVFDGDVAAVAAMQALEAAESQAPAVTGQVIVGIEAPVQADMLEQAPAAVKAEAYEAATAGLPPTLTVEAKSEA